MLDVYRKLTQNQFSPALCTLNACIEACPYSAWNAPVGGRIFCQVAFHTLFFADYYLQPNEEGLEQQPFHLQHKAMFRDYEELQDREPESLYDKADVLEYVQFVRGKADRVIGSETETVLSGPSGFERRSFTRAELHPYNMRHIQHHAAQLSLRSRLDFDIDIPWFRTGWTE